MNIEINKIEDGESVSFRSSHKWNTDKLKEFALKLREDYTNAEDVRIKIDDFYNEMYSNPENKIKHLSYYCKQKLSKMFNLLEIDVRVGTTKKWDGQLLVRFL